jgi:hypothetical protein
MRRFVVELPLAERLAAARGANQTSQRVQVSRVLFESPEGFGGAARRRAAV